MSILLINPPRFLTDDRNIWKSINSCTPPFGLVLLASILEKEQIPCDILDCDAEQLTLKDIIEFLKDKHYQYIGITSMTVMIHNSLGIAKEIKEIFPEIQIVLGGVHPTIFYKELMQENFIDFIIRNEGEKPLTQLLKGENPETIDNLSYKDGKEIRHNQEATEFYDLETQPMLAYHKLPMHKYFSALGSYKRTPSIGMITSRGCPGKCTFCFSGMFGKKIRVMPAENIVKEILFLQKNYGIREISFYDDTFTCNRKNVKKFCQKVIDEKVDITWCCFARVDTVDLETLTLMKKAGCHQIMYGIESASEEILKNINKKIDLEKIDKALKLTRKVGIRIRGAFMIGSPGETVETIKETIDFAIELKPDIAIFNITTPYPGTQMFDWAKKNNYLLTENWSEYDLSKPIMELPNLSKEKIQEYYRIAYKKFYFRPSYLIRKFFDIRSFDDIKVNFKAFLAMFKVGKK